MVAILLADGFETIEALSPCDMLRRAGVEVALVGVNGPTVVSGQRVAVNADLTLDELDFDKLELVMLPGGLGGVDGIKKSEKAMALVQRAYDAGLFVTAICAAPSILGQMGLLQGKRAVVYPGMEDQLIGAEVCCGQGVVADGKLVTSQAAGSSIAFGLKLVELLRGSEAAERVRAGIHYMD